MRIIRLERIPFDSAGMTERIAARRKGKKSAAKIAPHVERAYSEGVQLLDMKGTVEIYEKADNDASSVTLRLPSGTKTMTIGERAGYLSPAHQIAVSLCTAGPKIADAIHRYTDEGDAMHAYYLDLLGILALAELTRKVRSEIEAGARARGWGVGPTMQPGSFKGWDISGQRDLYGLAGGAEIGLDINDSSLLIPHISDSFIIGIGPDYGASVSPSMCRECPRYKICLWRREDGGQE